MEFSGVRLQCFTRSYGEAGLNGMGIVMTVGGPTSVGITNSHKMT